MAIMLFMSLKIAKGWGEQIQVLTFSGEVEPYELNGSKVIQAVGETKKAGIEGIIDHLVKKTSEWEAKSYNDRTFNRREPQ